MTDTRARFDGTTIDRRKLLKIGAWAAPALLVATAIPAASASASGETGEYNGGGGAPIGTTLSKQAVVAHAPGVGSAPNEVQLWSARVSYEYGQWGLAGQNSQTDGPQSVTVTFRVRLTTTKGVFVADVVPQETVTIALYTEVSRSGSVRGVPAGDYLVVTETITSVFNPATVNGVTFVSPPMSASTPVTVKATW
jgi:hypothetical protein